MVERPCWEREFRHVARQWVRPLYLWCCTNCGDCLDATIAFHRALRTVESEAQRNERIWRRVRHDVKLVGVA